MLQVAIISYWRKHQFFYLFFYLYIYIFFFFCSLVLRILPPANFKVQCELGNKFGCHPKDARALLMKALELDLNVIGIR